MRATLRTRRCATRAGLPAPALGACRSIPGGRFVAGLATGDFGSGRITQQELREALVQYASRFEATVVATADTISAGTQGSRDPAPHAALEARRDARREPGRVPERARGRLRGHAHRRDLDARFPHDRRRRRGLRRAAAARGRRERGAARGRHRARGSLPRREGARARHAATSRPSCARSRFAASSWPSRSRAS